MRVSQVLASRPPAFHLSIRFSSAELTRYYNFVSLKTRLEPN